MDDGLIAEIIRIPDESGEAIEAYRARPLGESERSAVLLFHHALGWDEWSKEVVRKLAHHGYDALVPNLYFREGEGRPEDVAARMRAKGGPSDDQVLRDAAVCIRFLRAQPGASGKVAVMGHCSGGRHSYLAGCRLRIDAAVDCYGGHVVVNDPSQLTPARPVAPVDMTADLGCPLLGLFGNEDRNPSPADVDKIEAALKEHRKKYEFHRYDGAGHSFFATDLAQYRPQQAVEGYGRIFRFFGEHLAPGSAREGR